MSTTAEHNSSMTKSVSATLTCCKTVESTSNDSSDAPTPKGQRFLSARFNEKELTFEFEKTIVIYGAGENSRFSGGNCPYYGIPVNTKLVNIDARNNGTSVSFLLNTENDSFTNYISNGVLLSSNDSITECDYVVYILNLPYIAEQENKLAQKKLNEEKLLELEHLLFFNHQEQTRLKQERIKLEDQLNKIKTENKKIARETRFF